jgi:hypothetical protein
MASIIRAERESTRHVFIFHRGKLKCMLSPSKEGQQRSTRPTPNII